MENYLDLKNNKDNQKLKLAGEIIRKGGIIVFPTETVYGIGTNGLDKNAIKKLYEVKKRPLNKPISLLVSDFEMIEKVTKDITDIEYKLMKKFFPGPLTIILKKKNIIPDNLTNNENTVGIRMPEEEITKKLIEYAGVPIAASSANLSGEQSGIDFNNILEDFKEKIDYFIDGGKSKLGISSTVIKIVDGIPYILREGSIKEEEIEKYIKKCNKDVTKITYKCKKKFNQ